MSFFRSTMVKYPSSSTVATWGQFLLRIVEVDDLAVGVGDGEPDRAELPLPVDRVDVGHRRGLGEPVALDEAAPGDGLELLGHRHRERGRAGKARPDRGQVVLRCLLGFVDV